MADPGGTSFRGIIKMRRTITCFCIVLNCLTVGSSYCFPLYGPVLTKRMGLTMSQTNAISLGAILGQYASALFMGAVADKSCRFSALLGSLFFSAGYSMMAISLSKSIPPSYAFFVGYFLLVGAGTVSSYFAALTASAKSFPNHPGLAIGIPSALFGISPLLLSTVASALFTRTSGKDTGDLDAVRLFVFLAVLLGVVNVISAIGLRPPPAAPRAARGTDSDISTTGEDTPLLPSIDAPQPLHLDLRSFLKQKSVWVFLLIVLFLNGPSEVISQNLGSMSEALIPSAATGWPDHATLRSRSRQIQIFSLTNTFSRLAFGALSDFTCPSSRSNVITSKRFTTPRLTYLQLSSVLLFLASMFTAAAINSLDSLWILSAAAGTSYGLINVVGPSLVSKVYGAADFGRNFGILWSIAAVGPMCFGFLYGAVSDHFADKQGSSGCKGRVCFSLTFWVIAIGAVIAFLLITLLKRRKSWSRV